MENYKSVVYRLAARVAILIVPKNDYPDLVHRLLDFIQDSGSIGLLLEQYSNDKTIETVSFNYWKSRLEKSGSRFEDLVVMTLISFISSILAGIIVNMWNGEWGPLGRLFRSEDKRSLVSLSQAQTQAQTDLLQLILFYSAKMKGFGVVDSDVALNLYAALAAGGLFQDFVKCHPQSVDPDADFSPLTYVVEVSRGVVMTEILRERGLPIPKYSVERSGIPLCPVPAFGETIALFDSSDLGLGPNWASLLRSKLAAHRLHPVAWPQGVVHYGPSPKIIMLDDNVFRRLHEAGEEDIFAQAAGFISSNSGMVSHLAVMSRSLGIGAVSCTLSEEERVGAKFALLSAGDIHLYFDRPNIQSDEIGSLIAAMCRRAPSGD